MIAIPQRRLWVPDWMRAPAWFTGGRVLKPGGRSLASAGQQLTPNATATCCLYQARDCATNTLQSLYLKKSQFPSFPSTYYFKYSGTCYYVQSTDTAPCNSTPLVTGETAETDCTCGVLCQAKRCGAGLAAVYGPCPAAGVTNTYFNSADSVCYTLDNSTPVTGQTATATLSIVANCSAAQCVCPACSNPPLASTVTIGGLSGAIVMAATGTGGIQCSGTAGNPFGGPQANSCHVSCGGANPLAAVWNNQISAVGSVPANCYGFTTTQVGQNPVITISGGSCLLIDQGTGPQLVCLNPLSGAGLGGTCAIGGVGWAFEFGVLPQCGGGGSASATWVKMGASPIGTYTLCQSTSTDNCVSFPSTIMVS